MTITGDQQRHHTYTADAPPRRRRAIGMTVGGAAAIALLALFGTGWLAGPGDTPTASGPIHLVDQAFALPGSSPTDLPGWLTPLLQQLPLPPLQQVDDSGGDDATINTDDSGLQQQLLQQQQDQDQAQAQASENYAVQSMNQSEQLAQEQNDQAEQQFTQDELQAQQTEQQADQS